LNTTIYKPWPYLKFNQSFDINKLSKYACDISLENQSFVLNSIYKHFIVPNKLQLVKRTVFFFLIEYLFYFYSFLIVVEVI